MSPLLVNDLALLHSSHGAKRYAQGVLKALDARWTHETSHWSRWGRLSRLRELAARGNPDQVLWSPAQRGPLFAQNHVVTVLDCINVEHVYRDDWRLGAFRQMFGQVLRQARAVVAISHATRAAIARNYTVDASRISVIAGPTRGVMTPAPDLDLHASREDFAMMVVNALPHKNAERAVQAFVSSQSYRDGLRLRVIGAVDARTAALMQAAGPRIEQHRGVSDAQLSAWFAATSLLISPSLDEGLNLPIAEALIHRAMVAASDIPVHREFYAASMLPFDPLSLDSMRDAIDQAIQHPWPVARRGLPPSAPSFDDVARSYENIFQSVLHGGSN